MGGAHGPLVDSRARPPGVALPSALAAPAAGDQRDVDGLPRVAWVDVVLGSAGRLSVVHGLERERGARRERDGRGLGLAARDGRADARAGPVVHARAVARRLAAEAVVARRRE